MTSLANSTEQRATRLLGSRVARFAIGFVTALVTLWLFIPVLQQLRDGLPAFEWDFLSYRRAARAWLDGRDPYAFTPAPGHLRFLYPPLTLPLFVPFSLLAVRHAIMVWLALKFVALGAWGWLTSRVVLKTRWNVIHAIAFAWGFRETVPTDLLMGNISIFEQLVLWIGFLCLIHRRLSWFAACVIAVAQFKLLPMAFLLLIPMVDGRRGWSTFGKALAAGIAVWAVNISFEGSFRSFLGTLSLQDERGMFAPSSLAFARDVAERLGLPASSGTVCYAAFAGVLVIATWYGSTRYRRRAGEGEPLVLIAAFCVAYALIAPRMKDYSFALLIVPTLVAVQREWRARRYSIDLLVPFLPGVAVTKLFGDPATSLVSAYWPVFGALVLARIYGLALLRPRWSTEADGRQSSDAASPTVA